MSEPGADPASATSLGGTLKPAQAAVRGRWVFPQWWPPIASPRRSPGVTWSADSYGYRPGKSAVDAVRTARERCWRYDFVLDIDVKGFFDGVDWELLLKAVRSHTDCPWVLLYIERWPMAPVRMEDGSIVPRTVGTPQGGVGAGHTRVTENEFAAL